MIEARHVHAAFDRFENFLVLHRRRDDAGRSAAVEAFWDAVGIAPDDRGPVFAALRDRLDLLPITTDGPEGARWGALFAVVAVGIALDDDAAPTITDDDLAALTADDRR